MPLGYFGASTGAGAALLAAATPGAAVGAIVSRGGRPDLAGAQALARVTAPTLLIVGGEDRDVIALNRDASTHLRCPKLLEIVPGATHLFEEPGTLEQVAALAAAWFRRWLARTGARPPPDECVRSWPALHLPGDGRGDPGVSLPGWAANPGRPRPPPARDPASRR